MLPLHEHCLFKNGIHLGELWYFTPLANWLREHKRNRFLLTAPPLRLPGAVGSPATPIATVRTNGQEQESRNRYRFRIGHRRRDRRGTCRSAAGLS